MTGAPQRVAILGAGSGALATAVALHARGLDVTVCSGHAPAHVQWLVEAGGLTVLEGGARRWVPVKVSTDVGATLTGVDAVMVVAPAPQRFRYLEQVADLVGLDCHVLVIPGGYGLSEWINRHAPFSHWCELNQLPFVTRLSEGALKIWFVLPNVWLGASDEKTADDESRRLSHWLGTRVHPLASPVAAELRAWNMMLHPPLMVGNEARIARKDRFRLYLDGASDDAIGRMEAIDRERMAVARACLVATPRLASYLSGGRDVSMREAILGDPAIEDAENETPAPTSFEHRFLSEDVPYGLVPLSEHARRLGVATPAIDAIVERASVLVGRDLRADSVRAMAPPADREPETPAPSRADPDARRRLHATLAHRFGTPLYVVDRSELSARYHALERAFRGRTPTILAYSYKTLGVARVCAELHGLGAWAEIIPGFELDLALRLRVPPGRIIVNGPYKPVGELERIVALGCHVNVDNVEELEALRRIAVRLGRVVPIGLRVSFASDEGAWSKFGFSVEDGQASDALAYAQRAEGLALVGVGFHLGTNIPAASTYLGAVERLMELVRAEVRAPLSYLDVGGGFASSEAHPREHAHDWHVSTAEAYAEAICGPIVRSFPEGERPTLVVEPGRYLVDDATSLLASVFSVKRIDGVRSVLVDAGVNLLPSAYERDHPAEALERVGPLEPTHVFGPLCMQTDTLLRDHPLPPVVPGDVLRFPCAGAYSLSHSRQFIRTRPAVVWFDEATGIAEVIRRAETADDILGLEVWEPPSPRKRR